MIESCHCYCVVCSCDMCFRAVVTMVFIVTRSWVLVEVDKLGKEKAVIILTVFTEVWARVEDAVEH